MPAREGLGLLEQQEGGCERVLLGLGLGLGLGQSCVKSGHGVITRVRVRVRVRVRHVLCEVRLAGVSS